MAEIAYNLYRVSTTKQVDKVKDDIPMQREACREFAQRMGWTVGKEFLEKVYLDLKYQLPTEMRYRN